MRQFLSLGGGVQSTTLLLMSLYGEIENPVEAAIFADTGWERQQTYETVGFLREYANKFGVPVYTVSAGNIRDDIISDRLETTIPAHTKNAEGKRGFLNRRCTRIYKLEPVRNKLKEIANATYKNPVEMWIGISIDEAQRMSPARVKFVVNRYPLIEKRISRQQCYEWLNKNGFAAPIRSSCVGCPYNSNKVWNTLTPEERADVAVVEKAANAHFQERTQHELYFHQKCIPIQDIPFEDNTAQLEFDLEDEECEGGCFL